MERKAMKVDPKKREVKISLNSVFYPNQFVSLAMDDFSEVCTFDREGSELILKPKKGVDVKSIGHEFCNYVLGLMGNQGF